MRDVNENALELVEHTGEAGIAFTGGSLAIQAVFLEQVLGALLFGGNVDDLLAGRSRLGVL